MDWVKNLKRNIDVNFIIKVTIALSIILLIAISAIIRANYNYIDDQARVLHGSREGGFFSRYITSYFSMVLHSGMILTDISPLPQIIAVIEMAIASSILIYIFSNEKELNIWKIIAVIPATLSPYFLECLSYKYDSPFMALSVLSSTVPFLFYNSGYMFYIVISFLGNMIMCMTYQASSGIYPLVTMLLCAKYWNQGRPFCEVKVFLLRSLITYVITLAFFKVVFMRKIHSYVSNNVEINSGLLNILCDNLIAYFNSLKSDATTLWGILIAVVILSFITSFVISSKRLKIVSMVLALFVVIVGSVVSFGAYLVLDKPLIWPRSMYGFGIFIALLSIIGIELWPKNIFAKVSSLLLAWSLIAFSFTYGNAMSEQKRYTDFRTHIVLNDISKLNVVCAQGKYQMMLFGTIGKSPVVKNMEREYKILPKLIRSTLKGDWWWSEYYIYNYFALQNVKQVIGREKKIKNFEDADIPIAIDTSYHTIKKNDKYILIKFK